MKIIKDISWNTVSYIIPMLVAIPALGVISRYLDIESFGLFMLIYTILGYASIFDLGFTRALVRCISRAKNDVKEVREYILSSTIVIFFLSIIPLCFLFFFSDEVTVLLGVSDQNHNQFSNSLSISAFCFPVLMIFLIWGTYFEGTERFKELALIKVITSLCLSLIPMTFTILGGSLTYAVIGIAFSRLISLVIVVLSVLSEIKKVKSEFFCLDKVKSLFRYGSWLTLTNIISPLLTSIDRFVLSSSSGANNLALYTAPSEMVTRALILPGIVSRTLFPKFARENDIILQSKAFRIVAILMLLLCTVLYLLSDVIITLWLGSEYIDSVVTFKILIVGLFFCGIAQLPYMIIQAKGFSKVAATVHTIEVVPYLILLYYLVESYQYNGAAIAWTIRVSIDGMLFLYIEKCYLRRREIIHG